MLLYILLCTAARKYIVSNASSFKLSIPCDVYGFSLDVCLLVMMRDIISARMKIF